MTISDERLAALIKLSAKYVTNFHDDARDAFCELQHRRAALAGQTNNGRLPGAGGKVVAMSAIGKLRSLAESREHDAILIRDGISYGDAREALRDLAAAKAENERLREALREIRDRKTRNCAPWTHEAAADEYSRMLACDRDAARRALDGKEPKP